VQHGAEEVVDGLVIARVGEPDLGEVGDPVAVDCACIGDLDVEGAVVRERGEELDA
jgi:hypothetical protein